MNTSLTFEKKSTLFQDLNPEFLSIIELLKKKVNKHANKTAIIFKNESLTYEQLDKRSNQVAGHLQKQGVCVGTFVGCCLENSPDLIVTVFGILKAGGVYVPIEPSYPQARIEYMLRDVKPAITLTNSKFSSVFVNFSGPIIELDRSKKEIESHSEIELTLSLVPSSLAYVAYTSGSTGNPKGILVDHFSFTHAATAHQSHYNIPIIGLLSSSISFDVNLLIIFHLLTSGGTIVIPPVEDLKDAEKIARIIIDYSINYILCVPSLYSTILDKRKILHSLKIVSLTGENISNSILDLHSKFAPNAILYNEYGPSEYAIGTTISKVYDPKKQKLYPISIGKPLPNTQVFILDRGLNPVTPNSKGEICIAGNGLAKGYLNNPELTAQKFISSQYGLIYRTGDFGRFLPNGNLEFLGRIDQQVKIRGYRVELGEIENAACKFPEIDQAVVVLKERANGTKLLVAYFTSFSKEKIKGELKSHLSELLPSHMVPDCLFQLTSFPRTPIGKIDRAKLPDPIFSYDEKEQKKPVTKVQKVLFFIWKAILCLDSLCIKDNFFELGGSSLGIAKLQTGIEKELGIKLSVATLLQYPTIFELAEYLNQKAQPKNIRLYQDRAAKRRSGLQQLRRRVVNE